MNDIKCYHLAKKAAVRTAIAAIHLAYRAFLCKMRLDGTSLHQIRAEGHVKAPRQGPPDRPLTQPRSSKFSTSNRRENQKAILSAGIKYRKETELKRDSFLLPISSRKREAAPSLVHNKVLVRGFRDMQTPRKHQALNVAAGLQQSMNEVD